MVKKKGLTVLLVMLGFLMVLERLTFAHHADSVYDQDHLTTVTGTVTAFEFINPHSVIRLEVKDDKGNVEQWIITGSPPNRMRRLGWHSKTLVSGEQITVTGNRWKTGKNIMLWQKIVKSNGERLPISSASAEHSNVKVD